MSVVPAVVGPILTIALGTVAVSIFVCIRRKRRRIINLPDDFGKLKLDVANLLARWKDINDQIERQSESIEKNNQYPTVEKKVFGIQNQFAKFAGEAEKGNQTNKNGAANENQADIGKQKIWTRDFLKLARLDKDIVKLTSEIPGVKKMLVLADLTRPTDPKIVERKEAEKLGNILPSHQRHLNKLLQYVMDHNCKRIGIIGASRVGKTNILRNLNNCLDSSSPTYCGWIGDYVIWVTVPEEKIQEKLIQAIQNEIIDRLKLPGGTRSQNTEIISSFLSQKKYLVLLDDFSLNVKLEDVGIKEEHENGKVVMAAKHANALGNVGLNGNYIEVQSLSSHNEASNLFKSFIDNFNGLSEEHKSMVYTIVKPFRLPEPIKFAARYLNVHRHIDEWKGIKQRTQSDMGIIEIYTKPYEDLTNDLMRKCLMYAALFPSGCYISRDCLVECWKAEDFLTRPKLRDARSEGRDIFNKLEDDGLLEKCSEKYVKMLPFLRKAAFLIPFPDEGGQGSLCVRSGSDIDGQLEERDWNNARRVSFIGNDLKSLPKNPKCNRLSTLFLQHNPDLKLIERDFFTNMKILRVLDLHGTGIASLPLSISNLIALRSLYLNDCGGLNELPTTFDKLKELEVLDIRGTSIPLLPAEILNIASLRCLRISISSENCNLATGSKPRKRFLWFSTNQSWVIFPPESHTKLPNLEEMTIELQGEVSYLVRNDIKEEAAEFRIRENFQFELGPHPGQSFGPYSQASQDETGMLSIVIEGSAGSAPSTAHAVVPQSNITLMSEGQNTTFQSHSHGQKASYCRCFGSPWVTSSLETNNTADTDDDMWLSSSR